MFVLYSIYGLAMSKNCCVLCGCCTIWQRSYSTRKHAVAQYGKEVTLQEIQYVL
jgi:uncharacterized protein YceK